MLAIFASVKNEASSILEWLAFHKLQGFEHFVLILDACTDNTQDLIENSQFASCCNLIDAQTIPCNADKYRQSIYFRHAIDILKNQNVEWAIPVDVDEYVFSPQGKALVDVLSNYPQAGVAVSQRVFGSAGLDTRPEDSLVIESFTKHLADDVDLSSPRYNLSGEQWIDSGYIKVFVRPSKVVTYTNVHFPVTSTPFVHENLSAIKPDNLVGRTLSRPMDILRINHYFAQDRQHWNFKMARGRMSVLPTYTEHLYQVMNDNANCEDLYLKNNWAEKVKELLNAR